MSTSRLTPILLTAFAAAVLFPGVAGVVEALAVELDGEFLFWPAAIDSAAAHHMIRLRPRQCGFAEAVQEA